MIRVLYGIDDFSVRQKLIEIQNLVIQDDIFNANLNKFHASTSTLAQIKEVSNTVPFMASQRLIVLEGLLSIFEGNSVEGKIGRQKNWVSFDSYVKNIPETTELVLIDGDISDRNSLLRKLTNLATIEKCKPKKGYDLIGWINSKTQSLECTISLPGSKLLADLVGSNLWIMNGEIEKLSLYCSDNQISVKDVTTVVSDLFSREVKIFDAIDSIFSGRNAEFLKIIQKLKNEGETEYYIITMFARQLRLLLLAKNLDRGDLSRKDVLDKLSSNKWAAQKTLDQSQKYSENALLKIHAALIDVDYLFKRNSIDDEDFGKLIIEGMANAHLESN
jgi:DNA polymerase-3 subunit delta